MENSKFIKILQRKGFRAYRATEKRVCEQKDDKYSSVYFIHHRRGNGYPRQIIVRMKIRTIIFLFHQTIHLRSKAPSDEIL